MKKVSVPSLLLFVSVLTFCSLKNDGNSTEKKFAIMGTWYWQKSIGRMTGNEIITPKSTGVDKKLIFGANQKVTVFTNDAETGQYNYTIKMGNSIFDNKQHYLLTFNEMSYVIQYVDNKNLSIQDNFTDGYVLTYAK